MMHVIEGKVNELGNTHKLHETKIERESQREMERIKRRKKVETGCDERGDKKAEGRIGRREQEGEGEEDKEKGGEREEKGEEEHRKKKKN